MLLAQGRGPKIILVVALILAFLLVLHLSSFPAIPTWKSSTSDWQSPPPLTVDPELGAGEDEQELAHEPLLYDSSEVPSTPTPSPTPTPTETSHSLSAAHITSTGLPCQSLQGSEEVLVIMRTGATETKDKLTVHLNTTFQCYPNLVIFSDYAEEFHGHKIHDVLRHIPDSIKNTNDDFKHYLHVQTAGREGLDPSELSGAVSEETGGTGKNGNPGWALDKWKFLPMINETYALYPDKKYYVFVEPDSYLVWSNFLQWIPKVDATKALYFGSQVAIGDIVFAHGGSVFMLTRPAVEAVHKAYNSKTEELNKLTQDQWAGDAVLGKTLKDNGVPLTFSFPQFQGGNPSFSLDWEGSSGKLWCTPAISYHHLVPYEVEDFWQFEQGWIEDVQTRVVQRGLPFGRSDTSTLLHHSETFKSYVMPNMTGTRENWNAKPDTLHENKEGHKIDFNGCKTICEDDPNCWQYALGPDGCSTGGYARFGQQADGFRSGWLPERVQRWVEKMDAHCANGDWTTTG